MKYYVIAGEASGDLHGAHLLHHLKQKDSNAVFRAWGGDKMRAEGAEIVKHIKDLAFMGWWEVLMNIRTISKNFFFCKKDVQAWDPDVIVMIDFPGFNLKLVRWFHEHGYKIIYYISPQVWAWKEGRVEKIKKYVDHLLVILPFEEEFYAERDLQVDYVGHPLRDSIGDIKIRDKDPELIALLPGSRAQEISNMLPIMLEVAQRHPQKKFIIAAAPNVDQEEYEQYLSASHSHVEISDGDTYALLTRATYALVTSGTATLETALHSTLQVVCYKGSRVSFEIAKRLVNVKYISLVNLILDDMVVTELIQQHLTPDSLDQELKRLLDPDHQSRVYESYARLHSLLGDGNASAKAAQLVYDYTVH